ncbi:MAG: HAD-IC family P-type ATPase [Lachnospiraceae bacterium]
MKLTEILSVEGASEEKIKRQVQDYVCCLPSDNETMKALKAYFRNALPGRRPIRLKAFSSQTKYSALDFGKEAFLLGAPEFLMQQEDSTLSSVILEHYTRGERVLLFAGYEFESGGPDDIFEGGTLAGTVQPLALLILTNPIRENAQETFQYFTAQDVAVKVISGDNALTAALTAQKAGIPAAEKYIDMSTVDGKKAIGKAAQEYTVFGRVTPEQKSELIRAMKKAGHTVAMTGDGVNDVLALKEADCAIAMASGSDAASNVADLVLLESDFSAMPQIVAEGRRVINNIQRSASLYLMKNIFSFILCLISLISVSLYPLKPAQIAIASAVIIGIPSFFLALEPNEEIVKGKFLRNVLFRAFPAALTAVVLVEWSLLFADAFSISTELSSTIAFYLYSVAAYLMLYRVCKPMNIWHGILFGTMGAAYFAVVFLFPEWFQIVSLDYGCILILTALLLLAFPIDRFFQLVFTKCEEARLRLLSHRKN